MTRHRWCLAAVLVAGCATFRGPSGPDVEVVTSDPSADIDQLADEFFGLGATSPRFLDRLSEGLQKDPQSGEVHEVAGYWALLEGDDAVAFEEFLRAAADTRNPDAALDIDEMARVVLTRSEMEAAASALGRIAQAHPDPLVRATANRIRANELRSLGKLDAARSAVATLGFIARFQVLGAFDNEDGKGFTEVFPPEDKVDLSATCTGSAVPVGWRPAVADDLTGEVSLADWMYPSAQAVAYAAVWVRSPSARSASLRLSSDGPVAAWVDQLPVIREPRIRHWGLDNSAAAVALQEGWNEVLVKSAIRTGPWSLAVRFTDARGEPMLDLDVADHPPTGGPSPRTAALAQPKPEEPPPGPREAFRRARAQEVAGLTQPGLAELESLLAVARENPLLRFFNADAAWADGQTERALDLLTSGISAERAIPAFLRERAAIYAQKDLFSQAERDLDRDVKEQPNARSAQLDLARLAGKRGWGADKVRLLHGLLHRWPDFAEAEYELAMAQEADGAQTGAEQSYQRALDLLPGSAGVLRSARKLYEQQNRASDVRHLSRELEQIRPGDVGDRLARAEDERRAGDSDAAEQILRGLAHQTPDNPTVYVRLALLAEARDQRDQSVALLEEAQRRNPRDSWVAERLQHLQPAHDDALSPYVPSLDAIELAARKPTATDPSSHVEVLLFDRSSLVGSDGSQRWVETEVLRAVTQQGRDELVKLALPTAGTVRVLIAYARTPEGRRQDASSVDKASVRFRNLAVGSTVVLQYAYYPHRSGPMQDDFWADLGFAWFGRHVDQMSWTLVAPRSKALYLEVDPRVKQIDTESGDRVIHRFSVEDVPALASEPGMVAGTELLPHVSATTLPNWESFIHWEKALLDESFPADPAIDALAARLTSGASTPQEKLGKLFAFVAQEIRYQQEYESILAGWQPHRSAVVLERRYGDCKDKATLLIALSHAVGINVEFAVLATRRLGRLKRDIVFPEFNHAIAYVPTQAGIDQPVFLDPTVDALDLWNLRDDDQGSSGLVLDPASGQWSWIPIPYQPPKFQAATWRLDVRIDAADHATATSHMEIRGSAASSARKALRNEQQSKQFYEYLAAYAFPGARVTSAKAPDHEAITHPLTIDEEIDASSAIRAEGDHFRLPIPGRAEATSTKLEQRLTPLELGPPSTSRTEWVFHLGKGLQARDKPAAVDIQDPCFHLRRTVSGDKFEVTVTDEMETSCPRISVADYPRYRAAVERSRALTDTALVFEAARSASR